jgi:hypothetical protein
MNIAPVSQPARPDTIHFTMVAFLRALDTHVAGTEGRAGALKRLFPGMGYRDAVDLVTGAAALAALPAPEFGAEKPKAGGPLNATGLA